MTQQQREAVNEVLNQAHEDFLNKHGVEPAGIGSGFPGCQDEVDKAQEKLAAIVDAAVVDELKFQQECFNGFPFQDLIDKYADDRIAQLQPAKQSNEEVL